MIRAFFFDLDGTLQDSEILWVAATRNYLVDQGADLPLEDVQSIVYGHGWREVFQAMTQHAAHLTERGIFQTASELRLYYQRLRETTSIALPGSVDLLRRLSMKYPVAIVSGSTRHDIQEAIALLEIGDCVGFFMGAEDYGPGKPNPDCYLLAARKLKVDPADCVVFEDSTAGVLSAKAAGMRCVALALAGHPHQDLSRADLVLADLGDFKPSDLEPIK